MILNIFNDTIRSSSAGMRFALMILKLVLAHLLRNYTFSIASKMELPVKIKKRTVLVCCDGGIWLDCTKRNIKP